MASSEQIQKLLQLLELPDSDYWYDVGCEDARALLTAGGEQLLAELILLLNGISPVQQEHLAYILGESAAEGELAILEVLKESPHSEVAYRSREALLAIPPHKA